MEEPRTRGEDNPSERLSHLLPLGWVLIILADIYH